MRLATALLAAHAAATLFALAGLLVALPHPEWWAHSPAATAVFAFGMRYGGALHIALGAAAMAAFGGAVLGRHRTAIFAVAALAISLASELAGTRTGLPFGRYAYTDLLGPKVLDLVPIAIPLSWFSVGLAAWLLALYATQRRGVRHVGLGVAGGAWLLVVWDLVLDPAMAHDALPVRFWVWQRSGSYFGMPLQNFAGWWLTGAAFMAVSRAAWGGEPDLRRMPVWFPLLLYAINLAFAVALSVSVGLWQPPLLALALGVLPLLLVLRGARCAPLPQAGLARLGGVRSGDAR